VDFLNAECNANCGTNTTDLDFSKNSFISVQPNDVINFIDYGNYFSYFSYINISQGR